MNTTVLLADDHPVVRAGLRQWIANEPIQLLAEAGDGREAAEMAAELRPSVLVLEVILPRFDGFRCLAQIRESAIDVPVLCYTGHRNPTYAARAAALGAAGFVAKSAPQQEVIDAIHQVAAGGAVWPSDLTRRLTGSVTLTAASGPTTPLTAREGEVLKQLAYGLSNKEIAQALEISYETVKEHVQHILRKLHVADRTQAAVWAVRQGLA